jgi:hypothetical protein
MWALDRQVDSIARNDRMIEMMQKRQNTIDEHSRYSAHSLDQVQARFADIRAKQEAKLEAYSGSNNGLNYEDKAKYDLDAHKALTPPTSSFDSTDGAGNTAIPGSAPIRPSIFRKVVPKTIIQIRPEDLRQALPEVKPIAMR